MHPTPRWFHRIAIPVALLAAVASTWPIAAHLSDHVIDGARLLSPDLPDSWGAANSAADVITTVWILNWVLHALVTQPLHLFDANIFYPTPLATARQEHLFATDLLGAPGLLAGGPVVAHQTALLLCLALSAWAMAYVVARWCRSLLGGLVAGVLFAVSPFHQMELTHLQSLGTACLPLIVLGLERFGATGRPTWAGLVSVALALQILSGQYLGYMALSAAVVAGIIVLVAGRPGEHTLHRLGRDAAWLGLSGVAAALAVLPFVLPYFRLAAAGDIPDHTQTFLNRLFILRAYLPMAVGTAVPQAHWSGIPAATWLLASLGTVVLVRGDRADRVRVVLLVSIGYVGAALSLGPRRGIDLWEPAAALIPGFGAMREPIRFALLPCLAMAMLGGCGAAAAARRFPRAGTTAAIVLLGLAVSAAWRGPLPLRRLPVGTALPAEYRVLAQCGDGDPLLELPMGSGVHTWMDAEPQLFSVFHWLPLLNGRASYSPRLVDRIATLANHELPAPDALDELRRLTGVRWVLVHCRRPPTYLPAVRALCQGAWKNVPSRSFDGTRLFDLGRVPALPRPVPRREPPTAGCLKAVR